MNKQKSPKTSSSSKLVFKSGIIVGLITFVFSLIINLLGAQFLLANIDLLGAALFFSYGGTFIAFILSFFVARNSLQRNGIDYANHVAATVVLSTYIIVNLVSSALPFSDWYSWPVRALLFAAAGGVSAILFNRIFKKIGAQDSANLVVFVVIVIAFFSVSGLLRIHF